eukprot:6652799-Ditylum_brightwellii.AAC.1
MAFCGGHFPGQAYDILAADTVQGAISYVAQTFRDNGFPNPSKDEDDKLGRLLSCQLRAYKNQDPPPVQQKALPGIVLKMVAKKKVIELQRAVAQLTIGAFFFACRSCEYLKVLQSEKRRTGVLRLRKVRFLGRENCVSIMFEWQKKDTRQDTVTHLRTGDLVSFPVRQWAAIVQRIWRYKRTNWDTPVSTV